MTPLEPPVRVLVKGSSLVVLTPEWNGERGEHTFPRWIQTGLHRRGRPAEIDNRGVSGELTRSAFKVFEQQVVAGAPDVVVYGYAYYECIHAFLPHDLERHVNNLVPRSGPIRSRYRSLVLRPFWKVLAQTQRVLDRFVQDRFFGRRVRRVIADYELLITRTRRYGPGSPLVLVLELLGPGGKAGDWFPGMNARIAAMNRALESMVERIGDPDVRLVPVPALAARLPAGNDPVPDGLHYSPAMRRLIGDWIAEQAAAYVSASAVPSTGTEAAH